MPTRLVLRGQEARPRPLVPLESRALLLVRAHPAIVGDIVRRELAPITPRALSDIVARYAALARVEDVSPHDLR